MTSKLSHIRLQFDITEIYLHSYPTFDIPILMFSYRIDQILGPCVVFLFVVLQNHPLNIPGYQLYLLHIFALQKKEVDKEMLFCNISKKTDFNYTNCKLFECFIS